MDPSPLVLGASLDMDFEPALPHHPYRYSPTRQQLQRSYRISKPPSTGNSPKKGSARRSTLSSGYGPSQTGVEASPLAWQTRAAPNDGRLSVSSKGRPISWHPSSHLNRPTTTPMEANSYFPHINMPSSSYSLQPFTTTQINGLITPLSQPCYDEPLGQEIFPALDDSQPYEDPYAFLDEFRGEPAWSTPSPFPGLPLESSNYQSHQSQHSSTNQAAMDTAPPSPASVTMASEDLPSPLLSKIESATEELVGMGLYDPPTPYDGSSMSSITGASSMLGKGLKLEETFEPPPPGEEDEIEEDDNDEEDKVKEQQPPHLRSEVRSPYQVASPSLPAPPSSAGGWI